MGVELQDLFPEDINTSKEVALIKTNEIALVEEYKSDDWMKPNEVADYFRVDPKTVSKWYHSGKIEEHNIRVITTPGGHRRYSTADIIRVVAEQ